MSSTNTSRASTPAPPSSTPPTTRDEDEISKVVRDFKSLSPSKRFERWRPSYHLQPRRGWMNDPCAPCYNRKTGLYHVSFQWNPHGNDWGDISWCSATSPDMLHWTVESEPSLSPDKPYDQESVFTGCLVHGQDGSMNYFYTSVSSLPIHHTLPHVKGCESLSLASSHDNGRTWTKSVQNPILPNEPEGYDVIGWRDPYVAKWPRMSAELGFEHDTLFGVISGGIRDLTPTTFLYVVDANDLTKWEFVAPIVNLGLYGGMNRWSGDYGRNWEVTNFLTLKDEFDPRIERDFLIMGTEGHSNDSETKQDSSDSFRPYRHQLWMSVSPRKQRGSVTVDNNFSGILDHGCMYAANSFHDPVTDRQVVYGWVTEDDVCDELRQPQGWSGMLSLPRELRMQTITHVVGACASDLTCMPSIELEPDANESYTVRTLASQPCPSVVQALRSGPDVQKADLRRADLGSSSVVGFKSADVCSSQWELNCSFRLMKSCRSVGILINDPEGASTMLVFDPRSETFTIHRPAFPSSDSDKLINSSPELAPHTLFTIRDPATGEETIESLDIQAWRDKSVLEVFVNGRTAITTRVYAAGDTCSIQFFSNDSAEGDSGTKHVGCSDAELLYATLWDRIGTS